MSFALSAGVTGLKVHQTMLDVAGNNLANINTTGYKSSNVTFAELLSQTVKKASGPSGGLGGTNPQQIGSGVGLSNISKNMTQGNIVSTGQDLDVAIDGEGYLTLNDGEQNVYTRIGSFGVDADNTLVDPATGYKVQRIGTAGENEGFQIANDTSIHIPWDASMPASATTEITLNGNLRSSAPASAITTSKLTADLAFTTTAAITTPAVAGTLVTDLDQFTAGATPFVGATPTGTLTVTGYDSDGTTAVNGNVSIDAATTMQDVLDGITAIFPNATASLDTEGRIVLTDTSSGYSKTQVTGISYTPSTAGTDDWTTLPTFFDTTTLGGNDSKSFNITIFDSMGGQHILTGTFVKTDTINTWDLVIGAVTGESDPNWATYDINSATYNRRIDGIQFDTDGSYIGLTGTETPVFGIQFENNPTAIQNISLDLGTIGEFTGLTQFASDQSSASALRQDGYEAGELSSITIDNGGMVVGTFTNGVKVDVAALQIALFQNPAGLESVGGGYYLNSANSGVAVATMASTGGAGVIKGQSLEKSNVDVATEFVNMMQAQNGFQANARTIRVANEVLRELTNLIR